MINYENVRRSKDQRITTSNNHRNKTTKDQKIKRPYDQRTETSNNDMFEKIKGVLLETFQLINAWKTTMTWFLTWSGPCTHNENVAVNCAYDKNRCTNCDDMPLWPDPCTRSCKLLAHQGTEEHESTIQRRNGNACF
jgi:hypothetical protein